MGNFLRMNPLWIYFVIVLASFFSEETNGKKLYTAIGMKNKFACVAENLKEATTYYCDEKGNVRCLPGWTDESTMCKTPLCAVNNRTCLNGRCHKPFVCTCDVGWTGQFCEECIRLPGCVHGTCSKAFECSCNDGYEGMVCDKPTCDDCIHGDCVAPNVCACHAGWAGINCTLCQPRVDCAYGTCEDHPFECKCFSNYNGSACDKPVCREGCHPQHGYCDIPETCICNPGWSGLNCDVCVPYWNCEGYCENEPWECICPEGKSGPDCKDNGDVDGNWGRWGEWSACSATCGYGSRKRTRECDNPRTQGEGKYCSHDGSRCDEMEDCDTGFNCPTDKVDGNWGHWEHWSTCSVTCGGGNRQRFRACDSPSPANGGEPCSGERHQTDNHCNSFHCPVGPTNGNWGSWETWQDCSVTCGKGYNVRIRQCNNPPPMDGGEPCRGQSAQQRECNAGSCHTDGNWGDWSTWSTCSNTCGEGYNVRSRQCNNPIPSNGGSPCEGDGAEQRHCNDRPCPVDGNWGHWQHWTTCSATCGGGNRDRIRTCDDPPQSNGGLDCEGPDRQHDNNCNHFSCPDGPTDGHWGSWETWQDCSKSCGTGSRLRTRHCNDPPALNGGEECAGSSFQREPCNDYPCTTTPAPVDGNWGSWRNIGFCSVTCGDGTIRRRRDCNNPPPSNGGLNCVGNIFSRTFCYLRDCRRTGLFELLFGGENASTITNGNWGSWLSWTTCSVTCGGGLRNRTRSCNNPPPHDDGQGCGGNSVEIGECFTQICPINGGYSEWSSFGNCSVTCENETGVQVRTRICNNPEPKENGLNCTQQRLGDAIEEVACKGATPTQILDSGKDCYEKDVSNFLAPEKLTRI